ncbi:MAG: carboxypeptidase regulatory-like domain-containing protein [Planctomycetes bacterium]|nr:carboxypeptidase regulatory-like domain-containing protein [Planctomycetota bacterium]
MVRIRTWTVALCALAVFAATTARAEDMSVIQVKVGFKGNPDDFKREVIDTSKDPNCAKAKGKIGTENVVINKKGDAPTLRNVLVSIKSGLGDKAFPAPKEPAKLTQVGCHYEPHVLGIVEGQPLKVFNGDDTNHNIHFLPKKNEEHNFSQPKKDETEGKELKLVAEDVFKVKCDVHPWMGCYIAVFKHPFFSVTGEDGTYEIKGMPPGKYTLEAWHEEFGTQTAEVEVKSAGEAKTVDFTFEGKKK